VRTVLQQEWATFKPEQSVLADLMLLLAMAPNVTFAELLGFVVQGDDATPLLEAAAVRLVSVSRGEADPVVSAWHRSDPGYFE